MNPEQEKKLLETLRVRFEKNTNRHKGINWAEVQAKLEAQPRKLQSLYEMEETGGEPDVVNLGGNSGELLFVDCSAETPKDRRNFCYDQDALDSRKTFKPKDSAVNKATKMGIELLTEEQYRALQELGNFDEKTSSWVKTPEAMRKLGGGLFADYRFGRVFMYHNGAESYYGSRGFRGVLKV